MASLLHQLCRQSASGIPAKLRDLYDKEAGNSHVGRIDICSSLQEVAQGFSKVFVVVDGLDECPSRDARGAFISHLAGLPSQCQLLTTSRHLPELEPVGNFRLEIHASRDAIRGYLEARIKSSENLRRHIEKQPTLEQSIVDAVTQKAEGM